jgi:excisionase family DNA binding protein
MTDVIEYTLSTGEVAKRLGYSLDTIARWADKGLIACWKTPGGYRRFRPADVDAFAHAAAPEHSS